MENKICGKCNVIKSTNNFHRDKNKTDGLNLYCKMCKSTAKPRGEIPEGSKRCSKCRTILPFSHFYKSKNRKNGIDCKCITCHGRQIPFDKSTVLDGFYYCKACKTVKAIDCFKQRAGRLRVCSPCIECKSKSSREAKTRRRRKNGIMPRDSGKIKRVPSGMKHCRTCKILKNIINDFYSIIANKYMSSCKECTDKNPELNVKIKNLERNRRYRAANKEKVKTYNREYKRKKWNTDITYKLSSKLRTRQCMAISKGTKSGSAVKDLGCTVPELKIYLEKLFYNNPKTGEPMTWDNWSKNGWHIDHIKPLISFNLEDPEQVAKACHFANLQPLWWFDNYSKHDRLDWSRDTP